MSLSKTFRMLILLSLNVSFFVLELVFGLLTGSLALVADSFHMLSDVASQVVALVAIRLALKKGSSNVLLSYGWQRVETVGAFVNATTLLALCFTIFLDALERFAKPNEIENPKLVLIVGCVGLAANLVGLLVVGHDHSHSHSHDHGWSSHSHSSATVELSPVLAEEGPAHSHSKKSSSHSHDHDTSHSYSHSHGHAHDHSSGDLNMRGVFLHVLGDALGSVGVIISSLIIWLVPDEYRGKYYADPIASIVFTAIIVYTTVPLLMSSGHILLQGTPRGVDVDSLAAKLRKAPHVTTLHDLHIWHLRSSKLIASVHLVLSTPDPSAQRECVAYVKRVLHDAGVHSSTVQVEVLEKEEQGVQVEKNEFDCLLPCGPGTGTKECETCCD
ncbi:cation efflux protein [Gonapodya prolifera JEL478]|uniref:Cation efflux protein n=1 Tax=Gonapodya prolifera (strain JEL478) TaxID=1344416 RepID=A0A139A462_GONPJ|nr:cation efflux protein [Gonapodya prolifera JEL478]|eukprot:KXS11581.1 cation efflux protein [Gonapodya prolifera JEL478]